MADTDPRHRGFAGFSLRPPPPSAEEPPGLPARRGIAGAPPPKPTIDALITESTRTVETSPSVGSPGDVAPTPERPAAVRPVRVRPASETTETRQLGVQRHHMRYVQFQVSPALSDLLTERARAEDVVLGEVVMDALRHLETRPPPTSVGRRRRRSATSARRSILVRPHEAEDIRSLSERLGYTPSALIRTALEQYLG